VPVVEDYRWFRPSGSTIGLAVGYLLALGLDFVALKWFFGWSLLVGFVIFTGLTIAAFLGLCRPEIDTDANGVTRHVVRAPFALRAVLGFFAWLVVLLTMGRFIHDWWHTIALWTLWLGLIALLAYAFKTMVGRFIWAGIVAIAGVLAFFVSVFMLDGWHMWIVIILSLAAAGLVAVGVFAKRPLVRIASAVLLGALLLGSSGTFINVLVEKGISAAMLLGSQAAEDAPGTGSGDGSTLVALPTVKIDKPLVINGKKPVVSKTQEIAAVLSSNVDVTSVQFKLDGKNIGVADMLAPYVYSWDTTTAPKGDHTIQAVVIMKDGRTVQNDPAFLVAVDNSGTANGGTGTGNGSGSGSDSGSARNAPLHEVGPGDCVPGAQIVKDNPKASLTELKANWVTWIKNHEDSACVKSMAAAFGVKVKDLPTFVNDKLKLTRVGEGGRTVQNTYYDKNGKVVNWEKQTFPKGELIFVYRDNGLAAMKFVCGNILHEQPKPAPAKVTPAKHTEKPTTPTTPSTPDNSCKKDCNSTPDTGCKKDCSSTPDTGCKKDCGSTPDNSCKKDCGTPPDTCKKDCNPDTPPTCEDVPEGQTCGGHGGDCDTNPTGEGCTPTEKPDQTKDCMLNGGDGCAPNGGHQNPQDNTTSGIDTGNTPGSSGNAPVDNPNPVTNGGKGADGSTQTAPNPNDSGYNSGSQDGSTTPHGSSSDGQNGNASTDAQDDANGGNNGIGDDGNSNGSGHIEAPTDA
jgi:hypothetical protein